LTKLDYDPAYAEYNAKIIKTLQSMTADGRKRNTVKGTYKTPLSRRTNGTNNTDEAEYISKAAQTKEEAMKLIDAGFQYIQTIDGYHIYRKRK
jgi:hypothetical protein